MKMPDAAGMLANALDGITASERVMPRIETQPYDFRIGQREQFFYFRRGFHKSPTMMVEYTADASRGLHRARDVFHSSRKHRPPLIAQTLFGANASCILGATRVFAVIVGQDNEWSCSYCRK